MAIQNAKRRTPVKTAARITSAKLPFPVLLDPDGAYIEALGLPGGPYPVVWLLDGKGQIQWVGAPQNRKAFEDTGSAQLERLLGAGAGKSAGQAPGGR